MVELFVKHAFGAFLIRQLYFNSKFQMKLNTKVMLVLTLFINTLLLFRYMDMANKGANWWATILLTDIILYYAIVF